MTAQELRELDEWIEALVMGTRKMRESRNELCPHYTTDPADAMDVLKKCAEKKPTDSSSIRIDRLGTLWAMSATYHADQIYCEARTLELAICLFAKQLFSQPTTK